MSRKELYLSLEQEVELGKRVLKGDIEARNRLVVSHMPLVTPVANKYVKFGRLDFDDLLSEGHVALIVAAEKFDYRVARFSTYAMWWVRTYVREFALRQRQDVRLPQNMTRLIGSISMCERVLTTKLRRTPTAEELAKEVGVSVEKLDDARTHEHLAIVYLDASVGNEEDSLVSEFVPDMAHLNPEQRELVIAEIEETSAELKSFWASAQAVFTHRCSPQSFEIFARYHETQDLEQTSEGFGISRQRVDQIIRKGYRWAPQGSYKKENNPILDRQRRVDRLEALLEA